MENHLLAIAPAIVNHLWQSTVVLLLAFLVSLVLRRNHARTRYWLWLMASLKFLIPFSLLISLGNLYAKPASVSDLQSRLYIVMDQFSRPFPQTEGRATSSATTIAAWHSAHWLPFMLLAIWICGVVTVSALWCIRWLRVRNIVRDATPVVEGREWEALRRVAIAHGTVNSAGMVLSNSAMEPGIFGVVRPVLLWPAGISDHLDDAHLEAILGHELQHVRRRDNLAAALHMLVAALFWFYPPVWWLGKRLIDERERACDESVLQRCDHPQIYAESILKVCQFSLESPLPCIAGVTGSDLKERIVRIMSLRTFAPLSLGKRALLIAGAIALLAGPVLFGLMQQTPDHSGPIFASSEPHLPVFEVASVKPNKGGMDMTTMAITPVGFSAHNIVLKEIIREAYRIQNDQILGVPDWVNSSRYDIEAKVATADTDALHQLSPGQRGLMIQPLLADRFGLKVHTETRNLPVLTLTVAKGGSKLHEAKPGDTYPNGLKGPDGKGGAGMMLMGIGKINGQAVAMPFLVESLSRQLGSMVQDETGLKGNYDVSLEWTPDTATMKGPGDGPPGPGNPPPADSAGPSLYTALQEQLGLKLESRKVPVQVLVIDHVQPPSEN
jgi:bla regulator protein blaR1